MAATLLEMQSMMAVIRAGGGGKRSCRKRRGQQMMCNQCNVPYILWAGKNMMKTIYLPKALATSDENLEPKVPDLEPKLIFWNLAFVI